MLGAIAGGIAEAYYGVPKEIEERVYGYFFRSHRSCVGVYMRIRCVRDSTSRMRSKDGGERVK